jgi:hypothetical protein
LIRDGVILIRVRIIRLCVHSRIVDFGLLVAIKGNVGRGLEELSPKLHEWVRSDRAKLKACAVQRTFEPSHTASEFFA